MSETKQYLIGFQTGPYSARTQLLCDIEDVKVGDYVVAPAGLGDSAGRVMSVKPYVEGQTMTLKKLKKVKRVATAKEIAELEEVFGHGSKDDDEELDPFEAALSKYYSKSKKTETEATVEVDIKIQDEDATRAKSSTKDDAEEGGLLSKLRFVAVILAVLIYMYYDKFMALFE